MRTRAQKLSGRMQANLTIPVHYFFDDDLGWFEEKYEYWDDWNDWRDGQRNFR